MNKVNVSHCSSYGKLDAWFCRRSPFQGEGSVQTPPLKHIISANLLQQPWAPARSRGKLETQHQTPVLCIALCAGEALTPLNRPSLLTSETVMRIFPLGQMSFHKGQVSVLDKFLRELQNLGPPISLKNLKKVCCSSKSGDGNASPVLWFGEPAAG